MDKEVLVKHLVFLVSLINTNHSLLSPQCPCYSGLNMCFVAVLKLLILNPPIYGHK